MEGREEERKGSGGAAAAVSAPGANLKDLVSREYYGHKKKVRPLTPRNIPPKEKPSQFLREPLKPKVSLDEKESKFQPFASSGSSS